MNNEVDSPNRKIKAIGIVAVAGLLVISLAVYAATSHGGKAQEASSPASSTPDTAAQSSAPASSSSVAADGSYKDGAYKATGDYQSPGGSQHIGVNVTLKAGVITEVSVQPEPSDSESREYQEMFANGYKSQVVGRKIDAVQLDRVSGSSLTSGGFNDALDKIKSEAKA